MKTKTTRSNLKNLYIERATYVILLFFVAVLLECTLFNFHFYGDRLASGQGKINNQYRLINRNDRIQKHGDDYIITKQGEYTLEYIDINSKIYNVYIEAYNENNKPIRISIGVKDEATKADYVYGSEREVYNKVKSSQYINIEPAGTVNDIIVKFKADDNNKITIKRIEFNKARPFIFIWGRVIAVWIIGIFLLVFRYQKRTYKIMYKNEKSWQRRVIYGVLAIQMLFAVWTINTSTWYGESQLNQLTDALLKGQVSLEQEVPDTLLRLDNPYDVSLRLETMGGDYNNVWDRAYYNEKFYVYFGILPVLLFYIPAKVLFHVNLNSNQVILPFVFTVILLSKVLLDQIIRVWFKKKIPFLPYLLCLIAFTNASGILWSLRRPDYYEIYAPASLAFTMMGLILWLSSIQEDNQVKSFPLILGSLCMALEAGCRPNWLIYSVLIFPIFWKPIFSKLRKPSKKQILQLIGIIGPYALVGIAAMVYNYVRFDSVFEFGSSHQLTVTDMRFSANIAKLPFGLWWYYLAVPVINLKFPFFYSPNYVMTYQGYYFLNYNSMGTIFMNLILLFLFCLPSVKDWMKQQGNSLYGFCLTGIITSFIQSCIVILTGGIHQRYTSDFIGVYLIVAIIIIFSLLSKHRRNDTIYGIVNKGLLLCVACTIVFQICISMRGENDLLLNNKPETYYKIERAVEFWL